MSHMLRLPDTDVVQCLINACRPRRVIGSGVGGEEYFIALRMSATALRHKVKTERVRASAALHFCQWRHTIVRALKGELSCTTDSKAYH